MTQIVLQTEGLTKRYGGFTAVKDLTLAQLKKLLADK